MTELSGNAYSQVDPDLWRVYRLYRPAYPHSLFQRIYTYHIANGGSFDGTAHDAGCGPGVTAEILALQFKHLICSDHSESAVDAARNHLLGLASTPVKKSTNAEFTFKVSTAEDMSWIEQGSVEMVTMSEALHWTDTKQTLEAAHRVLKPGGTFATWYYTQPRFPDNPSVEALFRQLQGQWCKVRRDHSPQSRRTLFVEQSGYDCIIFPQHQWTAVQRIKFNTGGDKDIWIRDDDLRDMRDQSQIQDTESVELVENATDWHQMVNIDWFGGWFLSLLPQLSNDDIQPTLKELEEALAPSGETRAVWPAVVLLANKRCQ